MKLIGVGMELDLVGHVRKHQAKNRGEAFEDFSKYVVRDTIF